MTSRLVAAVTALVVLLAGVVMGCSLTKPPAWNEAEMAVRSLPVPDGYTDAGVSRRGDDNCSIDPACEKPFVTRTFRPPRPTTERAACESFHALIPRWTAVGYQFDRWNEGVGDAPDLPCNLSGSMNGLNVGGDVSTTGDIRVRASPLR